MALKPSVYRFFALAEIRMQTSREEAECEHGEQKCVASHGFLDIDYLLSGIVGLIRAANVHNMQGEVIACCISKGVTLSGLAEHRTLIAVVPPVGRSCEPT